MIHDPSPEALSPRRQRSRARRSARIIDAALRIVGDDGLHGLTMARLADELDVSAGSLYRYFPSKQALIVALQQRGIGRIHTMLLDERTRWQTELPRQPQTAALCELLAVGDFYRSLADRDPLVFRLVASTLGDPRRLVDDDHAQAAAPPFTALLFEARALMAAAAECGAIDPGDDLQRTVVFWTSLHGVMMVSKLERLADQAHAGVFDGLALTQSLTTTLLAGWGAKPQQLRRALVWLNEQQTRGRR